MPSSYLPILIMLGVAGLLGLLALAVPAFLGPKRRTPTKLLPYESGKIPFQSPRDRPFPVKYYLYAMLFVLLDLFLVFLYLWSALARSVGWAGLVGILIFLLIAVVGYVYVWRKGGLEWE